MPCSLRPGCPLSPAGQAPHSGRAHQAPGFGRVLAQGKARTLPEEARCTLLWCCAPERLRRLWFLASVWWCFCGVSQHFLGLTAGRHAAHGQGLAGQGRGWSDEEGRELRRCAASLSWRSRHAPRACPALLYAGSFEFPFRFPFAPSAALSTHNLMPFGQPVIAGPVLRTHLERAVGSLLGGSGREAAKNRQETIPINRLIPRYSPPCPVWDMGA